MNDEMPPNFGELSRHMARNHIYLSVRNEDYPTACRYILKKESNPIPPSKVVVVVGAGASNDACGLPTGALAAQALRDAVRRKVGIENEVIDEELHRITVEYRLDQGDFEAVLLALSKFRQTTVLEELKKIYNRRHYPSLTYEVLAHWLKHRFIDAIVNFNFDELLDQAINDEIGQSGYYRVVSDGDCPEDLNDWLDIRERFRFPLYVKPHGTASHKSTMRFTRASYSLLPVDLVTLLTKLFEGSLQILIVGHAMQSVEFNDILGIGAGRSKLKFYSLGHQKPEFRIAGTSGWSECEFWETKAMQGGLGECIHRISSQMEESFEKGFVPRSIHRHVLIDDLFHRAVEPRPNEIRTERFRYLKDRSYVEIALAVSKAKGFINLEHLARGRAGQYFREMAEAAAKLGDPSGSISLLEMCRNLGLDNFGYSNDTLGLRTEENRDNRLKQPILRIEEFEKAAVKLAQATRDHLSEEQQKKLLDDQRLHETLMYMYRGEEVEVSSNTKAITNHIFADPAPLATFTSLHAQTHKMLRSENWDAILCTVESGKWLLQDQWSDLIKKRATGIAIIVADETYREPLEGKYEEKLKQRLRWLPWWLHNRHTTILMRDGHPVQAIFYERRLRTSHIAPLWLSKTDVQIAMDAFVAYWIKAQQYKDQGREGEITPRQVREASRGLIGDLYQ
jgi:hypothetical protein